MHEITNSIFPLSAAPGLISASPYAGAHGFPPTFAFQQAAGHSQSL